MHPPATRRHGIRIALASALIGALLSGCSTASRHLEGPLSRSKAGIVQNETVDSGEGAVLRAPLDPALRARLGAAYLSAGRFDSAATSFADAMTLGDTTPATVLRLALALAGSGREDEAAALLFDRSDELPAADLGLALALAGEVQPAIRFMEAAIRDGGTGATLRQNLALAYALAGRWREARLMAALDVPDSAIGARMERWAMLATMSGTAQRLAMVLRVPAGVADTGVPVALALAPITAPPAVALAAEQEAIRAAAPPAASGLAAAPQASDINSAVPAYLRRQHRSGAARW